MAANTPSYFPARDDVSIHSNAPSYTSTLLPTYDTLEPSPPPRNQTQSQQYSSPLPTNPLPTNPLPENYHVASWPSLTGSGHQNRAYTNVAARRAKRDEARKMEDVARVHTRRAQGERQEEERSESMEVNMETEAKSWDHLLGQMADWKEREKSWNEFKRRYEDRWEKKGRKKIFGRF